MLRGFACHARAERFDRFGVGFVADYLKAPRRGALRRRRSAMTGSWWGRGSPADGGHRAGRSRRNVVVLEAPIAWAQHARHDVAPEAWKRRAYLGPAYELKG